MTVKEALAFVELNGIVLESARGPVPNLAEKITGEELKGSWWAHKRSREIFTITRGVRASGQVLVCRLVEGKITYVHRRLWPALIRLADRVPKALLTAIREVHTPSGAHRVEETPFPDWVPEDALREAKELSEQQALALLGETVPAVLGLN
ncbi:MAG TPA: hypothetical protein VNL14_00335 [Candidatus Acidoferrales bacterium]|nr:hypothetical protein [Candidatus Acidoferrales bacterium]